MNKSIPLCLLLLAGLQNAYAQDTYTGAYVGVQLGYMLGDDHGREYDAGVAQTYTQEADLEGALYGAFAGYNFLFTPGFLAGVEGDFEGRAGANDSTVQKDGGVPDATYPYRARTNMAASLRGRLGYIFNVRTLVYLTGGYAGVEIDREWFDTSQPGVSSKGVDWLHGWAAGAGMEHIFTPGFSTRIEYRYSDYDDETISTAAVYGAGIYERQRYDEHSFRFGIAYRFW